MHASSINRGFVRHRLECIVFRSSDADFQNIVRSIMLHARVSQHDSPARSGSVQVQAARGVSGAHSVVGWLLIHQFDLYL